MTDSDIKRKAIAGINDLISTSENFDYWTDIVLESEPNIDPDKAKDVAAKIHAEAQKITKQLLRHSVGFAN